MALAQLTDLVTTFASRVLTQYQSKPRFMALQRGLTQLVQDVETAMFEIVAELNIDSADGVWLDYLGNFVNEPRAGANDTDYRKFIKARIVANRSQGRIEDLLSVINLLVGVAPTLTRLSPASLEMIITDFAMTEPLRTRLMQLLRATRAAGVRLMVLYWPDSNTDNLFTTSSGDTLEASVDQGFGDDTNPATGGKFIDADAP